ncbi:MAG: polysaccharide biosynthesis C-terminal domain-containing protein [Planctomycetota bacterium]|nr:polysaccharide biosynthesis C-terminal domain-containing protein [Planctomycetota bacterium]MEE2939589.1 polysaccharide biosynthesis C-terminal domain-containing protein [Planctomycetota bacterium]
MTQGKGTDSVEGLLRHTSIYAIAPLFQRVLGLVLIGLYTSALTPGEFGLVALAELFLLFLPFLVGTNLVAGLTRFYFEHEDQRDRSSVVSGTALVLLGLALAGALVSFVFRGPIASLLVQTQDAGSTTPFVEYIGICAWIVPFSLGTALGIQALQVEKRSKAVTSIQVAKTVFEAAAKLWLLFGLGLGAKGLLLGMLLGEAVFGTGLAVALFRRHGTRLIGRTFMPLVRYTLPLVPVGLFQLGLHRLDTVLISRLGPTEVAYEHAGVDVTVAEHWVGVYNLSYLIPMTFHMAAMASFMRIWVPNVFALRNDAEQADHVRRIGTLVVLGIALAYGQVALYGREGVHLIAGRPSYLEGAKIVPWVAFAYVFYALYALSQAALMKLFATRTLALLNGSALALNVALNLALIPRYGYLGAAMATAFSFSALAAAAAIAAARMDLPPFKARTAATAVAFALLAAVAGRSIDGVTDAWSPLALAAKLAVTAVMIGLNLAVLPSAYRAGIRESLQGLLRRLRRAA